MTYGVRCVSVLNSISDFHVVNQLSQDIMHVLFEGVVPYELFLLIDDFVNLNKYFTIEELNDRITCFSYTSEEARDKPSPLKSHKLSQSCKFNQCLGSYSVLCYLICSCSDVESCYKLPLDGR